MRTLWSQRELILVSLRRDMSQAYAGSMFGAKWIIVQPLFLVALLTLVFNGIFRARFGGALNSPRDYTVFILSGLVPWQVMSVGLSRAGTEIISNANLVKQVVFPVQVLPVKGVLATMPTMAVGMAFITIYQLVQFRSLPWTMALVPVLIAIQILLMAGIAFLASSVAVFFRDVKDFISLFVTAAVYLLPIVYLPSAVPGVVATVVEINPFSPLVWCYQDAIFFGHFQHPKAWVYLPVVALVAFYGGHRVFHRLRPHMGNVL